MNALWQEHGNEDQWGILLVDAANAFNMVNRKAMLWTVRHKWPSGARFAFNCYSHAGHIVLRGAFEWLLSREGVTQGDPLSMVIYGLALLPLVERLESITAASSQQA